MQTIKSLIIILATLTAPILTADTSGLRDVPPERKTELKISPPTGNQNTNALVIYFSRSGNTERMAKEIAKHYQASLAELEAQDYRLGFGGLINAVKDLRSKHAAITPEKLDLSPYRTIFIGAPIWWYSPAPPVWQFVHNNDFTDKNVVLFTTFNSSFKQKYINEFQIQVEGKGGHFINHIYVKRGRISQQIDANTLQKQTRGLLGALHF